MTTLANAPASLAVRLIIGDQSIRPDERESLALINPATGEEIGRVPIATASDLADALRAAARGFAVWRKIAPYDRSVILRGAAQRIRERTDAIARIMTLEQGKPIAESRAEMGMTADIFEWAAEEGRRGYGRVVPARSSNVRQLVLREPVGPVAAFTPWNFPALTPARKLAGALAAGCSIIIKPSEETPATALALVDALIDAGLPHDVVSVVFGEPAHISQILIASPVIRKVSFTGSTAVGKHLGKLAAEGVKRITLELGGHAPVIVTKHADVALAVKLSAAAKYRNAGQVCVSPSRYFVHESVYDEFVDGFTKVAAELRIGDGLDANSQMSTLANQRRRDGIEALLGDAKTRGARVRAGGERVGTKGFFFAPTVLTDVPLDAQILNGEPFGPVAVIAPFKELSDVIVQANRLEYGLAAYAFTRDSAEQMQLADGLETGMLAINHFGLSMAEIPFGGVKESGYGSEGGTEGLEAYQVIKSVTTAS
jgi:succinate-semialdehyde dehydrogenase/glutarate-semialdehyde dehydrogenase